MNDLSSRGPLGLKDPNLGKDPKHLAAVRELPCVICTEWGLPQVSPTAAHHCIHGRFSQHKAPDKMAIPLCEGHHQGQWDTTKIALHREPSKWRDEYGQDTDWISWVEQRLNPKETTR